VVIIKRIMNGDNMNIKRTNLMISMLDASIAILLISQGIYSLALLALLVWFDTLYGSI